MSETISSSVTGPVTLTSSNYPGPLTITAAGKVTGQTYGLAIELDASTLSNLGTITGGAGDGVGIDINGGILLNNGQVVGGSGGIYGGAGIDLLHGGAFTNHGFIRGGGGVIVGGAGISLDDNATLTNHGTIRGGSGGDKSGAGVALAGGGTVVNYGLLGSRTSLYVNGEGIYITGAGVVRNQAHGTIAGGTGGFYGGNGIGTDAGGAVFIDNRGVIRGGAGELDGGAGVDVGNLGTVLNTGSISGGLSTKGIGGAGVSLGSGATLINIGAIHGGRNGPDYLALPGQGAGAIDYGASIFNVGTITGGAGYNFIFDDQNTFSGALGGAAGVGLALNGGTLANGSGGLIAGGVGGDGYTGGGAAGAGIYLGFGASSISNNGTIIGGAGGLGYAGPGGQGGAALVLDNHATATVSGSGALAGGAGGYSVYSVGGNGGDGADLNGATLTVYGTLAGGAAGANFQNRDSLTARAGYAVDFVTGANALIVGSNAVFLGDIAGFAAGDTIDLTAVTATTESFSNGVLTLYNGGVVTDTLALVEPAGFSSASFILSSDTHHGTDITVECFCAGTMIRTAAGERAIESLSPGDLVATAFGGYRGISAMERRRHRIADGNGSARLRPVRIAAGALADQVPLRDLYVSPDHALYLDGVLVPAQLLIDGVSITQPWRQGEVDYYHIEIDPHDVIYAEGAATESYLNIGKGGGFYDPSARLAAEPKTWEDACAPLVLAGPALAAIRSRLSRRLAEQWQQPKVA